MKGEPLFLAPRRITNINFAPGIPHGTKTSQYAKGTIGRAQDEARERLARVAKTNWKECWYGVAYDDANRAYEEVDEGMRDDRLWSMTDIPTEEEVELIETFYSHWDEVIHQDDWTAEDMLSIFPSEPTLNIVPTQRPRSTKQGRAQDHSSSGDENVTPESEDDDVVEIQRPDSMTRSTRDRGKGKEVTHAESLDDRPPARHEMEVDEDQSSARGRFIREVKGNSSRDELFEVPTRLEGRQAT